MKLGLVKVDGDPRIVRLGDDGAYLDMFAALEAKNPDLQLPPPVVRPGLIVNPVFQQAAELALVLLWKEGVLDEFTLPRDLPLLCPFARPNRILAIGRNYAEHAKELGNAVPEEPIVFYKAVSSVIGPDENIVIPDWIGRVDYEAELLVVIGEGGKNISEADAMNHVVGYSVFNDVTAREKQRAAQEKRQPWFLAKSFDTSGPLGPYIVTKDEIPDPHNLRITLSVNGEVRQDDTTASMMHSIPSLIAYLSRWITLEHGDVIATGTPSGVGPLVPGDVVEATIEGIGTLRNMVVSGQ